MYFNAYSLPLFFSGLLLLGLSYWTYQYKETAGAKAFALLLISVAIYTLGYALETSSQDLTHMIFWLRIQYLGLAPISGLMFLFALGYTHRTLPAPKASLIILFFIPFVSLLIVWSSAIHELFYLNPRICTTGGFPVFAYDSGIWYWIHSSFTLLSISVSNVFFFTMWLHATETYRKQVLIVFIASMIPSLSFLIYILFHQHWQFDITVYSFTISSILVFWGLFRHRLFTKYPINQRTLYDSLSCGILVIDDAGSIIEINENACRYLHVQNAVASKHITGVLKHWPEIVGQTQTHNQMDGTASLTIERDNQWYQIDFSPLKLSTNNMGLMLFIHDVTAQKQVEQRLRENQEKMRIFFDNSPCSILLVSIQDGAIIEANPSAIAQHGCKNLKELQQTRIWADKPYSLEDAIAMNQKVLAEGSQHFEWLSLTKTGESFWEDVHLEKISINGYDYIVATSVNITERKQAEMQLKLLATRDELTGVWNRRFFMEATQKELERSQRYNIPLTLLMFDIDFFKRINDTFGHQTGDQALKHFTDILTDTLREVDTLARIGGEEFAVTLPETDSKRGFLVAERIRQRIEQKPFETNGMSITYTVSIGVTSLNAETKTIDKLLLQADKALYRAKALGRNRTILITSTDS